MHTPEPKEATDEQATYTLFGDESGHSGADLLKVDDPILVEAVVALESDDLPDINGRINEVLKGTQAPELKFSILHRRPKGRRLLTRLAGILRKEQLPVFIALVEKRFMLGSLVVETFLDPLHNPAAPPENKPELRQELANLILGTTNSEEFEKFLRSLRDNDRTEAMGFGERLAGRLKLHSIDQVRQFGIIIEAGLNDFYWFPEKIVEAPARHDKPNPLIYSFGPLLAIIHMFLEEKDWHADLIADEDAQFGPVFDHQWAVIREEERAPFLAEFGFPTNGLPRLHSYKRDNSANEPALQLADMAAGMIRMVTAMRLMGETFDESNELWPVWEPVYSCLQLSRGRIYVAVSDVPGSGILLRK